MKRRGGFYTRPKVRLEFAKFYENLTACINELRYLV